ncbi:hypothetical protein HMF7854_14450 [Sphingomonas ginkgonis]|uniref:Uncharacterized protein n=1 Tax=Sphingomonas ginkgonis TaxID=2315330 RepID=A0A3R9WQI4_9SPHN|nr:hypothetical protein [Sphingomonas ginkgonis]RST31906.1 hypothetical protein HMF7854_14450 [Sphingomonas ginkgonis]
MIPANDDPLPDGRRALLQRAQMAGGGLLALVVLPVGLAHWLVGTPLLVALAIDAFWLILLVVLIFRRETDAEGLGWAGMLALFTATPATLVLALLYGIAASW